MKENTERGGIIGRKTGPYRASHRRAVDENTISSSRYLLSDSDSNSNSNSSSSSNPSINNPVVCLQLGDSLLMKVSNRHFPVYEKVSGSC